MLLLTRKCNEIIEIGPDISIKVLRVTKSIVTLGVTAPKDKLVLRSELYGQKEKISLRDLPPKPGQDR